MECDDSWHALLKPGDADNFFDRDPPPFELTESFSPTNAWWLSELSRLIYKREPHDRQSILARVNMQETPAAPDSDFALLESRDPSRDPFAVLVFRGTSELRHVFVDLLACPVEWSGRGRVHEGFRDDLDGMWSEIERSLASTRCRLFYTGHSLGAALATLTASRTALKRPPVAVYTFGSPRVGDAAFRDTVQGQMPVYRIVNHHDLVARLPPEGGLWGYCHTGKLYHITADGRLDTNAEAMESAGAAPTRAKVLWLRTRAAVGLFGPPEELADHAPVNYVARLAGQCA
ncbi:MAG: lipase family protein [Candidatus Rokubacteria bacterium]|nr:lipase family protein [Candidatus Rokubacteria bacterium]